MGNVLASSKPPAPESSFGLPPLSSYAKEDEKKTEAVENPGPMEDLHKKCKDVFPVNFEGIKFFLNKGLSNHFQVSHTIHLSTANPSAYRFGATYVGTNQYGPGEVFPVLLGDIDPNGNMNANIIHQLGRLRAKYQAQIQHNVYLASQISADYKGDAYTASLTVANPDIVNGTGVIVAHYLQNVTPRLALGTELAYQSSPQIPGGQIAFVSLAARYTGNDFCWSSTFGTSNLHLCYHIKASEQVQFGVELETNFRIQESNAIFGYQVDLPKGDVSFKGMIDSNWNVGATFEKRLLPLPFTLAFSTHLNHSSNSLRLGIGCVIG